MYFLRSNRFEVCSDFENFNVGNIMYFLRSNPIEVCSNGRARGIGFDPLHLHRVLLIVSLNLFLTAYPTCAPICS